MKKENRAIVYIITKLELGGAQKVCLALFNDIEAEGYQTHIITSAQGELVSEVKNNPHAHLISSLKREVSITGMVHEIKNFFTLIKKLRALKKEHAQVIVHTHSTKAGILGRWAAYCAGIPTIIHTVHGFAFHNFQSKFKWIALYIPEFITSFITTKFVFVSNADSLTASRLFPKMENKEVLIRAAIDDRPFTLVQKNNVKKESSLFIVGTISCFKPQKNLLDLLKAFELAYQQNKNLRLEVIGDGQQRPALEAFIAHHHLSKVVTLHGWQFDVATIMQKWDLFALSSLWEGLPCAIVEARLLKLPIVSYNTGGISDIIFHGVNGLLYPQKAWEKLAQGILMIAQDATLYATLSHYPDNLQNFTRQEMVKKHAELYRQLE